MRSIFWSWLSQDKTKTNHFTPLNLTFAFQLETMIERGKQSCFRLNQGNKCFIWRQSRYLLEILTYRYLNLPRAGHLFHWSENESEAELGPAWAWSVPQCGTLARAQATHIFKPRISHAIYKWLFLANLVAENRDSVLLGWPTVPHSHRQRCTLEIFLQLSRNSHAASDANCRSICLTLQENCWDHRFKVAILICFAWVTSHFQVIIPCVCR